MRVAVMGAGSVGCYFGARLARAGAEVVLIGRPVHVEAVRAGGLRVESAGFTGAVAMAAATGAEAVAGADLVLVCVKSGDTEAAGRQMAPHLGADADLLSLQNGVDNAERLSAVLGRPVVPAAVYVATEMAGPGHVRHHGRGELAIGAGPGSAGIAALFEAAGVPTTVSARVGEALWGKLVMNCAYNALSGLAGMPYGRLIRAEGVAGVMTDVVAECAAVAGALGVRLPDDVLARTLALAASMPDQHSSTAQDLARGRPSEIDHLNGFVVRQGAAHGVPTPVNRALHALVKLAERRSEPPDAGD